MITATQEAFCSPEVTKLLEEKDFNEPVTGLNRLLFKESEKPVLKITHQKAMRWLREEHKIVIQVGIKITGASYYYQIWDYSIIHPNKFIGGMIDLRECAEDFNSYEDAVEAALRWTLENLI